MAELTLTSGAWMTCVWPTDGDTNILYNYGGEIIPPTTIWSETTTVETTTSFDTHALSEKEEESTDSTTEPEQDEESTQDSESESDDDSSSSCECNFVMKR